MSSIAELERTFAQLRLTTKRYKDSRLDEKVTLAEIDCKRLGKSY